MFVKHQKRVLSLPLFGREYNACNLAWSRHTIIGVVRKLKKVCVAQAYLNLLDPTGHTTRLAAGVFGTFPRSHFLAGRGR